MRHLADESGVTLVEIIIGMALLSVTLVIANLSFTSISRLQQKGLSARAVQQSGRYTLETLARDIRNSDVATVSGTNLTLINSLNGAQQIKYSYDSTNSAILRMVCTTSGCPAQGTSISGTDVRLGAPQYEASANTSPARFIKISLQVEQKADNLGIGDSFYQKYDLSTTVALRGQ